MDNIRAVSVVSTEIPFIIVGNINDECKVLANVVKKDFTHSLEIIAELSPEDYRSVYFVYLGIDFNTQWSGDK
jgi:hypothetical protein